MKNPQIYNKWNEFITSEKYKIYFISNEEEWNEKLKDLKKYIDENNKRPSQNDKITEIKILGSWFFNQIHKYKSNTGIMKNLEIQHLWYNFITNPKYSQYFDQDIALPDPLPDAQQSNNPLDDFNLIEPILINSEDDLYNTLRNFPDITSILNRYENKMNTDYNSIQ